MDILAEQQREAEEFRNAELFRKSKARIEKLWNELHVSTEERDEFKDVYFKSASTANVEAITQEVFNNSKWLTFFRFKNLLIIEKQPLRH
jgi:hypothetical protein